MSNTSKFYFLFLSIILQVSLLYAQMSSLHGDDSEYRYGVHSGNNFRTSFFNDGTWGGDRTKQNNWPGEWPINSGHLYLVDGDIFVISEVYENYDPILKTFLTGRGTLRHIQATVKAANVQSSTGDKGPDQATGAWWTFLPLPGFANPNSDKIAMVKKGSEWEDSWPSSWPDIADPSNPRYSPDGWTGAWNGYFGKNVFNADEESYFVADDYQKQEFPGFRPDTNDVSRGGLGVRMYVRGFQWDKAEIADVLFCHFEFQNIGTYSHDKMVFGYKIGNNVGDTFTGSEGNDGGSYDVEKSLSWTWDADGVGQASWGPEPTGIFGACFLESPGEALDGIDNDNDGVNGTGPTITVSMFQSSVLQAATQIVLIDYNDSHYRRVVTTLADTLAKLGKASTDTLSIAFAATLYKFYVGKTLGEIGDNMFDDNLNGVIDENRGVTQNSVTNYLYLNHKYIECKTGSGKNNTLIDESRDDGIDNDGNWNVATDDVGKDGIGPGNPFYIGPDAGEGDGVPTSGEPHFDGTDVNESDMLGLTSFNLYTWGGAHNQYDDEAMWQLFKPGLFRIDPVGNLELGFGSGYFSIKAGQSQRISVGLIAAYAGTSGGDTVALFTTKNKAQSTYNNNYLLPSAPKAPTVEATASSKLVTLTWDNSAENIIDPVLGQDFEGYRVYRSTNPLVFDSTTLIAQFDLDNEFSGYSSIPNHGKYFWLGSNSGIQHTFVDNVPAYGFDYYYVVTSYDHGSNDLNVPPTESAIAIYRSESGEIITGSNAAVVVPVDPDGAKYPTSISLTRGLCEGTVKCEIIDTWLAKPNHTYRITFQDNLYYVSQVKDFSLTDITKGETVLYQIPFYNQHRNVQVVNGLRLTLENVGNGALEMIEDSSYWTRAGVMHADLRTFYLTTNPPVKLTPGDFKIIFGDVGIDTSKAFQRGTILLPATPVNFTVMNTLTNAKVPFAFREIERSTGNGKFTANQVGTQMDQIIILAPKSSDNDTLIGSWVVQLQRTSATSSDTIMPGIGDALTLKSTRPFLSEAVFEFTVPDVVAEVPEQEENSAPKKFSLSQNYPNPFNPATTIRFSLPVKSDVRLFLVNTLGQVVKEIAKGNYDAGYHQVVVNGSTLASGVYFYSIETNTGFVQTKKLVLLK